MPTPGDLREEVEFQYRARVDDGKGNTVGPWTYQFARRAKIHSQRGRNEVMAAKLAGVQPVIITVRCDDDTRRVTNAWRIKVKSGVHREKVFTIVGGIENPDMRQRYLDIICQAGVAS
jgi:SPP1 family predicted phage head-tail adaptor